MPPLSCSCQSEGGAVSIERGSIGYSQPRLRNAEELGWIKRGPISSIVLQIDKEPDALDEGPAQFEVAVSESTHSSHFPDKMEDTTTVLYDLKTDPGQECPIRDIEVLARLNAALEELVTKIDAPVEAVARTRDAMAATALWN